MNSSQHKINPLQYEHYLCLHCVSSKIKLHILLQDQRLLNEAIINQAYNNEVKTFLNCNKKICLHDKKYTFVVSRDVFKTFAKVIDYYLVKS